MNSTIQPISDPRPDLRLRGLADQHLDMAEIFTQALLATQAQELLVDGAELLEEFATGPGRVLMIPSPRNAQQRDPDLGQPRPPVILFVAKTAEQTVPAHGFKDDAHWLILGTALETRAGHVFEALEQQSRAPLHRRHLQWPVVARDLAAEQRG